MESEDARLLSMDEGRKRVLLNCRCDPTQPGS